MQIVIVVVHALFLSTLSLRRATQKRHPLTKPINISIHALLAESDKELVNKSSKLSRFLSTLSLRRATHPIGVLVAIIKISIHALLAESDRIDPDQVPGYTISIHALLAESDHRNWQKPRRQKIFLSTLSLRRATVHYDNYNLHCVISIHALLAESDGIGLVFLWWGVRFLSTLSLRRATALALCSCGGACDFYPRSPCGERLETS